MKLTEIIRIESTNNDRIHLYPYKGGAWISYGASALLLHQLYPNISCSEKLFVQYGIKCPTMVVDFMSLSDLLKRIKIVKQTDEEIEVMPYSK